MFIWDSDIKLEYLGTRIVSTAESESFVLRNADRYEALVEKSIFNMSFTELRELFASQFSNSSRLSTEKNRAVLSSYIDFCISKNLVAHRENRLRFLDPDEFINYRALRQKYISRETLRYYQSVLVNAQDVLITELPFIGVSGNALEEIVNLSINDIDRQRGLLTLRQDDGKNRILEVEESTIKLINEAYIQEGYVDNNGKRMAKRGPIVPLVSKINHVEDLVFRVPGQKRFDGISSSFLYSRMQRIQNFVGNKYLTFGSLRSSGMIAMAEDTLRERGEVTRDDYLQISLKFNYGNPVGRYWYKIRDLFNEYQELSKRD